MQLESFVAKMREKVQAIARTAQAASVALYARFLLMAVHV